MQALWCKQEFNDTWHWEVVGYADGSTVKEVADNLAKESDVFAKLYDPEKLTFWGWELRLTPQTW